MHLSAIDEIVRYKEQLIKLNNELGMVYSSKIRITMSDVPLNSYFAHTDVAGVIIAGIKREIDDVKAKLMLLGITEFGPLI